METILVSACLLGVNCKYSGGNNLCPQVLKLKEKYHLIPVCPEQLGGLPTPRPASECQGEQVVSCRGQDVTAAFLSGAQEAVKLAQEFGCKKAVLKARSPSCGLGEIYDGTFTGTKVPGDGVTARMLKKAGLEVCTEAQLSALL
jgi:uncharacterized protein YbbK (DUF523 family)